MPNLRELQQALLTVNARFFSRPFNEPTSMRRTADGLEKRFGEGRLPDTEIVLKTIRRFVERGELASFKDIRLACFGVTAPYQGNSNLVTNGPRFESLLRIVDGFSADPKKLKRCFQGLMSAYLEVDGCDARAPLNGQWQALRHRLERWLPQLASVNPKPDWLIGANSHSNLFGAQPTDRYGEDELRGNRSAFDEACEKLGIGQTSWVRRRVVFSAIHTAVAKADGVFQQHLDALITLLLQNDGVRAEGAAQLLDRYARQGSTPEHSALRAIAMDTFGNPLINANRPRWFGVSDDAREMVGNWLKGFLIERFFELLSHDGKTDTRRPRFWLRHRASIENMWFVLGSSAFSNWNTDFKKLRETMGNQCLRLDGAASGNNAFVMRIGKVYVVEFGEKGNATYVFDRNSLPFDLSSRQLHLNDHLKDSTRVERLTHMDGMTPWERKFSDVLSAYGVYPDAPEQATRPRRLRVAEPPPPTDVVPPDFLILFKKFCNERGLRYDARAPSGRLVVYSNSANAVISGKLLQWGFKFERDHQRWVKNP